MSPAVIEALHLCNPLATPEQLSSSSSQLDGVPADLETSVLYAGARLTQIAGILLRLPQEVVAQSIVIFTRFWVGVDGGSLREFNATDISAASLYLTGKLCSEIKSLRSIINVYAYLSSLPTAFPSETDYAASDDPTAYHVSEGTFEARRERLAQIEALLARTLGFATAVALPHPLAVNYLQALGAFKTDAQAAGELARRALAHLNSALLSPQLLYLTHQPAALATAAVYLAAREVGVKLPGCAWWEVFDADREELGFLVVAMVSMDGFVRQEQERWRARKVPMTVADVDREIEEFYPAEGV